MPKLQPVAPRVYHLKPKVSAPLMAWVQGIADEAYASARVGSLIETKHDSICAIIGPVPRHTDTLGGALDAGSKVFGLVLRSDGHVLHSNALGGEGIELHAGDLYVIDPADPHWTTVPDGVDEPELIFTVSIMVPDKRSPNQLAHDFRWELLSKMIDETRG